LADLKIIPEERYFYGFTNRFTCQYAYFWRKTKVRINPPKGCQFVFDVKILLSKVNTEHLYVKSVTQTTINKVSMKCISIKCTNETEPELHFCNSCLSGMLDFELHVDDLVPGLENAIEPTWERVKIKRKERK